MSSNLNWNNTRSLNGLGFVSASDIAEIGDLTIEGDLTVDGDASVVGTLAAGSISISTLALSSLSVSTSTSLLGNATYKGNEIITNADISDLQGFRTSFNAQSNGIVLKSGTDTFSSTADNSSSWTLTSLWRDTFNSNVTTGELLYKSGTDTIDGVANNSTDWDANTTWRADFNALPDTRVLVKQSTDNFGGVVYGYGVSGSSLVQRNYQGDIKAKNAYLEQGDLVFDNGSNTLTLTEPTLGGDITITLPATTGTLATTSDVAYTTGFDVRINSEGSGYTVPSGGTVKFIAGSNITLGRSNGEITITGSAGGDTTALEAWRTNFNTNVTNGELCVKSAANSFASVPYSSSAGQANTLLQVDTNGYIQANRVTSGSNYISFAPSDITYFVPASSSSPVSVFYKHTWAVGATDIRMTMDSINGVLMFNKFIAYSSYTGSPFAMIKADASTGVQISTNGGEVIDCPASGEVSIAGGGVDFNQAVTVRGNSITLISKTAAGGQGTITMNDASSCALPNITCGTIGAGTNDVTCGLISAKVGTTAGEFSQFGTAKVGNHFADYATFQHEDAGSNEYALLQSNVGFTFINSALSQGIQFTTGNYFLGLIGGDATHFKYDLGLPMTTGMYGKTIEQSGDGGYTFTNNYVKVVNLVAGTGAMNFGVPINEVCFYALRQPNSTRAILNTTFDLRQASKYGEAVSRTFDYGTPTGYSSAVDDAVKIGEKGMRVDINIQYGHWCSTAGFFTCRLVGYCKDASTSYTWREMGEPWRYYMNSTSFHQTFSQTVDFEVAYPYCSHVALICNNTNFGGISTGTTSPVGVPQSNWGSYICITKTELPYYEN